MKQSEIDRALILFYRSNNAHDFINYSKPATALDKLPMEGLEEFAAILGNQQKAIEAEISRRLEIGQDKYSPEWYAERAKFN